MGREIWSGEQVNPIFTGLQINLFLLGWGKILPLDFFGRAEKLLSPISLRQ